LIAIFCKARASIGNPRRLAWERLLQREWRKGARGEAGWSAEWRKRLLTNQDVRARTKRWREYCCESFCDTSSVIYSGPTNETTLATKWQELRAIWWSQNLPSQHIPF
jgi:hypothetical protein